MLLSACSKPVGYPFRGTADGEQQKSEPLRAIPRMPAAGLPSGKIDKEGITASEDA